MQTNRTHNRRAERNEQGATSTELAVLMPVLILLVLLPMQVGLWWHAKQAAEIAAEEALDSASAQAATAADGQAGAQAILGQAGNLHNVTVDVNRGAETVTVTIHGDLGFSIFPGAWSVTAQAQGPVERFIAENER
ncbi:MAG: TadE/TadG family type IV pilus assembly protein [Acidimicrobiales bacterium]